MIEKASPKGSQARKRRGRDTEHMVARAFKTDGWPYAEPTGAGAGGRDITGLPGLACEVKARSGFDPMANLRQARNHAIRDEHLPFVVMRPNGYGETTIDQWPVFLDFATFRRLLRQAGFGDPLEAP
jgi:hypothetical protein